MSMGGALRRLDYGEVEDKVSILLLITAMLFLAYVISPLFNPGYNNAGDNFYHTTVIYHLDRLVSGGGDIFGWFHLFKTGQPLMILYQPLFYLLVVLVHHITSLDLLFAEKTVLAVVLTLYPASIFIFMKKMGYPKLVCGLGALFSVTSNAGWGNGISSYFYLGAITQSLAVLLFPLALGLFYESFSKNKGIFGLAIVLICSVLSHYLINFTLFVMITIMLALMILGSKVRLGFFYARKYAILIACLFLILSIQLLPLISTVAYKNTEVLVRKGWFDSGYQKYSMNTVEIVDYFFSGSMLDRTNAVLKGYNWYDNSRSGRLPLLTFFAILGLAYSLLDLKSFRSRFIAIGFLVSVLFLSGSDDIQLLNLLPFQDQMFYIRLMPVVEFFAICLAGVGLYQASGTITRLMRSVYDKKRFKEAGVFLAVALTVSLVAFVPLLYERYNVAPDLVDVAYYQRAVELERLFSNANYGYDGRLFVGRELGIFDHDKDPLFALKSGLPTIMTPDWEQYYTQQLLWRIIVQGNNEAEILRGVPYKPQLMELYNVKYLVSTREWSMTNKTFSIKNNITLLSESSQYRFYRVDDDYSYFKFIDNKPLLIVASDDTCFSMGVEWLFAYQRNENYSRLPFMVRSKTQLLDDIELDAAKYPAVMLFDYDVRDRETVRGRIRNYVQSGGRVYSWEDGLGLGIDVMNRSGAWMEVTFPVMPPFNGTSNVLDAKSGLQDFSMDYVTDNERLLVFKMSYFPGWRIKADGVEAEPLFVTPGFVGFWVPAGDHRIEISYHLDLRLPFLLAILGIALAYYAHRRRIVYYDKSIQKDEVERPYIYLLVITCLFAFIASNYVLQAYLGMATLKEPHIGEEYSSYEIPFKWDARSWRIDPKEKNIMYELQVSSCPLDFDSCIVFSTKTQNNEYFLEQETIQPDRMYSWRVRPLSGAKEGSWSVGYFQTAKNAPNIGTVFPPK